MIALAVFQETAAAAAASLGNRSAIKLSPDRDELGVRSGPLASRIARLRTAENRAVARDFLESLRGRFGDEVSSAALGTDTSRSRGPGRKPLRAMKVLQVIDRANRAKSEFDASNRAVSQSYCRPMGKGLATDMLRLVMERQARECHPSLSDAARLLNPDQIARMARDGIAAAGRGGAHRVTEAEAASIVVAVVNRELDARAYALEQLDAGRSDSIAARALTDVARSKSLLQLDPTRLSANAVNLLNRRFHEALEIGRIPEARLSDSAALRALALEVGEEFVRERLAAVATIENLPADLRDNRALSDWVAHDDVSPELVSAMAGAYSTLREDGELESLGTSLEALALEHALVKFRNAIAQALRDAEIPDGIGNQDATRSCWGFLLVAGGERLAGDIAERIADTDSRLGAVGAGINWFLEDFLSSEQGQRLSAQPHPDLNGMPICGIEAYAQALALSKIMNALAEAVRETGGASHAQRGFGNRSADQLQDADIAVLRNLGIPIPAPDRRGTENSRVWLPRTTVAAVQHNVSRQVARMGNHHRVDGVVEDSYTQFDDAALNVEGDWLARNRRSATEGLCALCSDANGTLNTEMLGAVSMMINEETLNSVHRACFDSRRPDLALFGGRPVFAMNKPTYELENDGEGNIYLEIANTGDVRLLEFDHASGSVHSVLMDPNRSRVDTVVRIFLDASTCEPEVENVIVSYNLSPYEVAPDTRGHSTSAPIHPALDKGIAGERLAPNFDRAGAIARLDQEIALQREEIHALVTARLDEGYRIRMEAELGARQLSRGEFAAGRDPRPALRARVSELASRYGADDYRMRAFEDTLKYFENSGTFAPAPTVSGDSLTAGDRSRLLSEWRDRLFALREAVDGQRPRSLSRVQRAEVLASAESFVQQAILNVSSRRNPVPELVRHAAELEQRRLDDGETAAAEATILRTMALEYAELR